MTREEAIDTLKAMQALQEIYRNEAVDMAIEALSADAVPHGRLIDADALIFELEEWKKNPNNDDSAVDLVNHFIGIIRATPSAEPSIVRCMECKSYLVMGDTTKYGWCKEHETAIDEWDFCSYGERREP